MGVFPTQTHVIILICNWPFFCNSNIGTFFKVILVVIGPKVIDNSLLHILLQIYKIPGLLHVIPTASNCKQWLSCH